MLLCLFKQLPHLVQEVAPIQWRVKSFLFICTVAKSFGTLWHEEHLKIHHYPLLTIVGEGWGSGPAPPTRTLKSDTVGQEPLLTGWPLLSS